MREFRFAARTLAKSPGFTAITVLALGMGIGATSSVFSVVDALLIRPLPFAEAERLVALWETNLEQAVGNTNDPAPANFFDWKRQSNSFEHLAAFVSHNAVLTGQEEPERLDGFRVSANLFEALGVGALSGRVFRQEEDVAGSDGVV